MDEMPLLLYYSVGKSWPLFPGLPPLPAQQGQNEDEQVGVIKRHQLAITQNSHRHVRSFDVVTQHCHLQSLCTAEVRRMKPDFIVFSVSWQFCVGPQSQLFLATCGMGEGTGLKDWKGGFVRS